MRYAKEFEEVLRDVAKAREIDEAVEGAFIYRQYDELATVIERAREGLAAIRKSASDDYIGRIMGRTK